MIGQAATPDSFPLDYHSEQFFLPGDHDRPVEATFRLNSPELEGLAFIGRVARFLDGHFHLALQDLKVKPGETGEKACLVSVLPLPIDAQDEERQQQVTQFWHDNLHSPTRTSVGTDSESMPTLSGALVQVGFARLHYEAVFGLGLEFHPEGGCNLIDLRKYPHPKEERPFVDLGDVLYDYEPQENPHLTFAEMNDSVFHARIESLVADYEGPLYHSMRFFCMKAEERCRDVFGCSADTLERALELLRLALIIELGARGALSAWMSAAWHPWGLDEMIEGRGSHQGFLGGEVPEALDQMLDVIGAKLGCQLSAEVQEDGEGMHSLALDWARSFQVSVERPSAHEVIEAAARLREMLS
ncbi:hypothetical protein IAD21_00293 [Abditibacteriota bacterium]|nr:hypothetical protein IAD21_00293 [Abditibacteriota bacterium]